MNKTRDGTIRPKCRNGPNHRPLTLSSEAYRSVPFKPSNWEEPKCRNGPDHPFPHSMLHPFNKSTTPDEYISRGHIIRSNNQFKARVLGMFPLAEPDTLLRLNWIEAATDALLNGIKNSCEKQNSLSGYTRMAADIAKYGGCNNSSYGHRHKDRHGYD